MYSEWASLQRDIQTDDSHVSVLDHFPAAVGREVAGVVVRSLAQNLASSLSSSERSPRVSLKSLDWSMQVLCHGLSLPLSEHETIKDCVNVYCEWLSAIGLGHPSLTAVPPPVAARPNLYARRILRHFINLFVPRHAGEGSGGVPGGGGAGTGSGAKTGQANAQAATAGDLVNRQTVLCHRVLRTVQTVATEWTAMDRDTWESLLKFLLSINDTLLAPPIVKDGLGEQLCERVLTVLFELWVLACSRHFPSPPLWKTFHMMCANWRHHVALVVQWHRLNTVFTARLLQLMYGPAYPRLYVADEDASLVADSLDPDALVQCWFRLLHLLGDPVELSCPQLVSNTPKFLHAALTGDSIIDPHQHACLTALQHIFYVAMRGIAALVDAFLGISQNGEQVPHHMRHSAPPLDVATAGWTPPTMRKNKSTSQPSFKGMPPSRAQHRAAVKTSGSADTISIGSGASQASLDDRPPYAPGRPRVNSILHLFGQWLVEAALVGVKVPGKVDKVLSRSRTASFHLQRDPPDSHPPDTADSGGGGGGGTADASPASYEAGRAEACGALCRVFCSHRTREAVLPVYLARFYIVLHHGLQTCKNMNGQVLASIILNSCDLLRVDLDGVQVLVPQILQALELVIKDVRSRLHYGDVITGSEVRKASIHMLLSMLCLPLHFRSLPIQPIFSDHGNVAEVVTFISLKSRTIDLLLQALLDETDSANTQMLLGGLLLCVQDLALSDEADLASSAEDQASRKASVTSSEPNMDSAADLFGHAASVVCARLMASWKLDLSSALAALEVLSGLARVPAAPTTLMCQRTVNWICEFIQYQCSRPAPAHSRDLHSMLCAAFHCLVVWLTQHDRLARDKQCLHAVLEVVELGISGSRSQPPDQPPPRPRPASFHQQRSSDSQRSSTKHKHDRDSARLHDDDADGDAENRASETPKLKADKDLKPVSQRVKDAAEQLLTAIMDNVGSFPSPCGPECASSLLDEAALLSYCKSGQAGSGEGGAEGRGQTGQAGQAESRLPLRYFVMDGTTIVGLLEQPLANDEYPLPTVTTLVRGPFGRFAWVMQLRHQARNSRVASRSSLSERPQPVPDAGTKYDIAHRYFPESVDKIPLFQVDRSIPALEDTQLAFADELDKLSVFIEDQVTFEQGVADRVTAERDQRPFPDPQTECHAPSICLDFQTSRLYLSHFNWLSLTALKEDPTSCVTPSLLLLDSAAPGFLSDLRQLDAMPGRTSETVHVFYVRDGQRTPREIVSNVTNKANVSTFFIEFVRSLGWPVDVQQHAGWTGHVATSWRIETLDEDTLYPADTGGSLYDGCRQVLYWADVMTEIAFVVPSVDTYLAASQPPSTEPHPTGGDKWRPDGSPVLAEHDTDHTVHAATTATATTAASTATPALKGKSVSLDTDKPPADRPPRDGAAPYSGRRFTRLSMTTSWIETKIFVVWLERFEDHENFPTDELLPSTCTGLQSSSILRQASSSVYIIFIHALQNGLYRIHTQGHVGKTTLAVPLVDGMVVSHRSLGSMVRQTASNIYRRKRLENEGYQPPHVRRKLKINELIEKYHNKLIEPDFYTALFSDSSK